MIIENVKSNNSISSQSGFEDEKISTSELDSTLKRVASQHLNRQPILTFCEKFKNCLKEKNVELFSATMEKFFEQAPIFKASLQETWDLLRDASSHFNLSKELFSELCANFKKLPPAGVKLMLEVSKRIPIDEIETLDGKNKKLCISARLSQSDDIEELSILLSLLNKSGPIIKDNFEIFLNTQGKKSSFFAIDHLYALLKKEKFQETDNLFEFQKDFLEIPISIISQEMLSWEISSYAQYDWIKRHLSLEELSTENQHLLALRGYPYCVQETENCFRKDNMSFESFSQISQTNPKLKAPLAKALKGRISSLLNEKPLQTMFICRLLKFLSYVEISQSFIPEAFVTLLEKSPDKKAEILEKGYEYFGTGEEGVEQLSEEIHCSCLEFLTNSWKEESTNSELFSADLFTKVQVKSPAKLSQVKKAKVTMFKDSLVTLSKNGTDKKALQILGLSKDFPVEALINECKDISDKEGYLSACFGLHSNPKDVAKASLPHLLKMKSFDSLKKLLVKMFSDLEENSKKELAKSLLSRISSQNSKERFKENLNILSFIFEYGLDLNLSEEESKQIVAFFVTDLDRFYKILDVEKRGPELEVSKALFKYVKKYVKEKNVSFLSPEKQGELAIVLGKFSDFEPLAKLISEASKETNPQNLEKFKNSLNPKKWSENAIINTLESLEANDRGAQYFIEALDYEPSEDALSKLPKEIIPFICTRTRRSDLFFDLCIRLDESVFSDSEFCSLFIKHTETDLASSNCRNLKTIEKVFSKEKRVPKINLLDRNPSILIRIYMAVSEKNEEELKALFRHIEFDDLKKIINSIGLFSSENQKIIKSEVISFFGIRLKNLDENYEAFPNKELFFQTFIDVLKMLKERFNDSKDLIEVFVAEVLSSSKIVPNALNMPNFSACSTICVEFMLENLEVFGDEQFPNWGEMAVGNLMCKIHSKKLIEKGRCRETQKDFDIYIKYLKHLKSVPKNPNFKLKGLNAYEACKSVFLDHPSKYALLLGKLDLFASEEVISALK